ncbi:glutathione S-transferase family protein [Sphingomonas sp.]|uniref:glutathione S-transferase family protein n=1 Tax=Sphingomonas sp. TaxID=28214 RepID=UPI0035BC86F8
MIVVHHLAYSRSIRVLWLLEQLGVPYELVSYPRTEAFRAPPELAKVHPLGKSPVIVDGDLVLAESSAILRQIHDRHGKGALTPPRDTDDHARHDEWLDYAESGAAAPIITLLKARKNVEDQVAISEAASAVDRPLSYIAQGLGDGPWLMGSQLTLADMQMSYLLALAEATGALEAHPRLARYLGRIRAHPAMVRAVEAGGPIWL